MKVDSSGRLDMMRMCDGRRDVLRESKHIDYKVGVCV